MLENARESGVLSGRLHRMNWSGWKPARVGLLGSGVATVAGMLVACSEPRHPTSDRDTVSVASNAVTATAAPDPTSTSTSTANTQPPDYVGARAFSAPPMPEKLRVDGKLDEWSFAKGTNAFVAVDSSKVAIAISWDTPPPASGISVALGARSTPYPRIGWVQRGGYTHDLTAETCEFQQIPLIEAGWENGPRNPPEVAAACKKILARYEKAASAYRERFVRRYRITATALESLDAPAPAWLADVKVVSGPKGVEVELPLAALPELAEAPLSKLFIASTEGDLPKLTAPGPIGYEGKPIGREGWEELALEKPASFGKLGPLLALVFPTEGMDNPGDAFGLTANSYHPSTPTVVREIRVNDVATKPTAPAPKRDGVIGAPAPPDRPTTHESETALFTTWKTFGDLEIGFSSQNNLVTLLKGVFVATDYLGHPDGFRLFEEDVHLFEFSRGVYSPLAGWQPPRWSAAVVKPDGTIISERVGESTVSWDSWDEGKEFHDKEWSSFSIQAKAEGKATKITWTWDTATGAYSPAP